MKLNAARLRGLAPNSLSKMPADPQAFGKTLLHFFKDKPTDENAEALANAVMGSALTLLLIQRGGQLDITPGNDISVRLGGRNVNPFRVLPALKRAK